MNLSHQLNFPNVSFSITLSLNCDLLTQSCKIRKKQIENVEIPVVSLDSRKLRNV